jgi:hypothetical protein
MLNKLTKKQEKIMLQTRDEWINLFFDNVKNQKGIDKKMFEEGIEWLYTDLLHKPNPKVVYCDSWLSCLLTIAILKDEKLNKSIKDKLGSSVRSSVVDSVVDSIVDSVGSSVWASVWASVRSSVESSVESSVVDSIAASVWASVGRIFNLYSSYMDLANYGWVSFYDFFEKINILDNFNFKQYKKILKSGVFNAYEFENCVFAIQPPIYVERNSQGRLHSTSTAAVKFRDGSSYYFINGRPIPEWVIEKKDSITKDQFLQEKNSDIKGAIYEVLGSEGIINLLGAEITDSKTIHHANGDVETVELLKTKDTFPELDNEPMAWVKMICPSTGTNYLIGVEPKYNDATEAIASLSPFTKEEYSFNFRS